MSNLRDKFSISWNNSIVILSSKVKTKMRLSMPMRVRKILMMMRRKTKKKTRRTKYLMQKTLSSMILSTSKVFLLERNSLSVNSRQVMKMPRIRPRQFKWSCRRIKCKE
jgi:hypothetical protein